MSTWQQIEDATSELGALKHAYLRRHGWSLTCNTPGSYWLWTRDFASEDAARLAAWEAAGPGPLGWPSKPQPYGRITAGLDMAVNMTRQVLDAIRHDEEGEEE